jgi:hypothetical protein
MICRRLTLRIALVAVVAAAPLLAASGASASVTVTPQQAGMAASVVGPAHRASAATRDAAASAAAAAAASKGTTGWDTYRQLDQLPYLPTGVTEFQHSSFDRTGGNADHNHVLGTEPNGQVILSEHDGPGEIDSIWTTGNVPGAGDLTIVLDGHTVVNAPLSTIVDGGLGAPFVYPLVADDTQSSGGFYINVPMPFKQSMLVTTTADPDYYHVQYRTFPDATGVSTFSPSDAAQDVLTTLQEAGTQDPVPAQPGAVTQHGAYQIMPGQSATVAQASGSGQVTGLQLQIPHLTHPTTTPLTDDGRAFGAGGSSSFTVALNPDNTGIEITRRYDPQIGEQKANLLVDGTQAGQWAPEPTQTGGLWADQTVDVPSSATAGKSQVTLTNVFVSSDQDFNEFRYTVLQQVGGVWQQADTVDVGPDHTADEAAHNYKITNQTWSGVRTFSYPLPASITDTGRAFGSGGHSQFTVAIDPDNSGVRLTRRLDPEIASQVASVSVDGTNVGDWAANPVQPAGNWADESIEIPASVTAGKSQITVTSTFVSSSKDFNEFTYWAYSHMPDGLELTDTLDVGNTTSEAAHDYAITGQTWSGSRTFSYPDSDQALTSDWIRISFDGVQTVNAPIGQFFGSALGDFDTRSLMMTVDTRTGWLSSWWPMPYGSSVQVSLYNASGLPLSGQVALTTAADPHWQADLADGAVGYFHATNHSGATTAGQDWTFLQATGHGKVVGIVQGMEGPTNRGYLEGDERDYTDGSASPQINGTGTEDFYQGGWYFKYGPFTNPLNGNTSHEAATGDCPASTDCTGAYRLLLADAIPFDSSITFGIEHGATDNVQANYSSTAFWYGQPQPVATQTDSLTVGNTASEQAHDYTSANPGAVTSLTASYEGNDGTQVMITNTLRATTAPVTFTMAVDPVNQGVILQRTSDQDIAFQSADIAVDGTDLGQWLQPLGNTSHRWLDDQYTLPASVTSGQSQITITITPTAGSPAWSAASYRAVSLTP